MSLREKKNIQALLRLHYFLNCVAIPVWLGLLEVREGWGGSDIDGSHLIAIPGSSE